MAERLVTVDGVELCLETFGDRTDPALLLIGGAAASMDWWDVGFCQRLADGGRFVVRYDHRDTGNSVTSPVGEPSYSSQDLATDPLRILDALGIARAHLVGLSMGGGIAQHLAARHPDRTRHPHPNCGTSSSPHSCSTRPKMPTEEHEDDQDLYRREHVPGRLHRRPG